MPRRLLLIVPPHQKLCLLKEGSVKFLSENFNDLRPLYINQLRSLLSVEEHLVRTLPDMVERATDQRLRQALQSHFQETEVHVTRLEKILGDAKGVDPTVGSTPFASPRIFSSLVT